MPRMIVTATDGEVILPASQHQPEEIRDQRMERILSDHGSDAGWNIGELPVVTDRPVTAWEAELAALDAAEFKK